MLAQIQDQILNTIMQGGVAASFAAWLLYRDGKRADAQEERLNLQGQQLQQVLDSVRSLIHALSLEVLTRPGVHERAKAEAQELIDSSKKK